MAFLEIRGVSKSFNRSGKSRSGSALPVLRDINLAIDEREFVCIVGRSGAGKTTLISLIAGLIEADQGEILLEGKPIQGPGPERGIVFQNYSLLPVDDGVRECLPRRGCGCVRSCGKREARADGALHQARQSRQRQR